MLALLQLDAVARPLVERMLAAGRLPALASLRGRGRWLELDAAATTLQSATYPTLASGVDVARHGIYSSFLWSAAAQRARLVHELPRPETVWERLTRAGRGAVVVDPVLAGWPRRMAGAYVSGWQFEDRFLLPGRSAPAGARAALARRHGRAPRLDDVYGERSAAGLLAMRDRLVEAPARAATAALELLPGAAGCELLWVNFASTHKAGHQLWDAAAVVDAPLDEEERRRLDGGLAEVYEAADAALGRIVAALPPATDLVVFSPTGMAVNRSLADLLPGMLAAVLGGARAAPERTAVPRAGGARAPVWTLRSAVPARWRETAARLLPDRLAGDLTTRLYVRADWSRTRAFAVPGENRGYVRLNLRGRERRGIVEPAAAAALVEEIAAGLRGFVRPDGEPAVARVRAMADVAGAGHHAGLPDLVVEWSELPAAGVSAVRSAVHGEVRRSGVGSGRSGNHDDEAWALLVPGRARFTDPGRAPRVTDLAATACALAGAGMEGLSGRPLLERNGTRS